MIQVRQWIRAHHDAFGVGLHTLSWKCLHKTCLWRGSRRHVIRLVADMSPTCLCDSWDSAEIIGTSLYVHKSVATTTTNHELRRPIPLFLSISNWIFGPTSPLYHRYYPHPWCRRKIFVWYVEMLPKYTAECPTIKNNTNNNAATIVKSLPLPSDPRNLL